MIPDSLLTVVLASRKIIEGVDSAFLWLTIVSLVLFVGIVGLMLAFIFKYHRSRNPDPAEIHGNTKLEITWTVIPTLIAVWMFFIGYDGFKLMRTPPEDAYVIEAIGRQWSWTFRYPDEDVTSPELYVPVNTPIKVKVSSPDEDVLHSLYIPHFRVKEDCVPGKWGFLWFEADEISTYNIFCAEFCGKDHSKMLSKLHVLPKDEFEKWLDDKLQERYLPVDVASARNPQSEKILSQDAPTMFKTYCASCHGPNGEGGLVEGARNFRILTNWKRSPKETDIYKTLSEGLPGTQMRSFANLPPWARMALMHHVRSFYEGPKAEQPKSTDEEWAKLDQEYQLGTPPVVTRKFPLDEAMKKIVEEAKN